MAKCFDVVGYIEPCKAVRQKYTGRALLIMGSSSGNPSVTLTLSDNGLKVTDIEGENTYTAAAIKKLPLIIDAENPFGVTVQGNTDSGRVMYTKTIPVSMPATRDGRTEEFIMGLQRGVQQAILVVEKANDGSENGEVTDVFGAHSPVRIDPTSVTRSEYENGGAWQFNIVCEEPVPNVFSGMTDLAAVLDAMKA